MTGIAGGEWEHLLNVTRRALGNTGPGSSEGNGERPAAPKAEGNGEAADGLIRATVSADGEIRSVEIAPRAMRLAAEEIGEHVATAVNAAFQDLRSGPPSSPDTESLTARASELQDMSLRQMTRMTQSIADLMAQLHGGRR